jgi:DNA-binding CsgD family transcriptional regulator
MLPVLLDGIATERHAAFREAERLAREAGSVWAQVSALTWMAATNPSQDAARWLHRLLDVSGWRRPSLVPPHIAADAALGLMTAGRLGRAVVELAVATGRPNVSLQVAMRHCEDPAAPVDARATAIDALKQLGTTQSREALHRLARRSDAVGAAARTVVSTLASGLALSEREIEVVDLAAHGLTNRQIADRLVLSPHTVARHLANARGKLGATNRADAGSRLAERRRVE